MSNKRLFKLTDRTLLVSAQSTNPQHEGLQGCCWFEILATFQIWSILCLTERLTIKAEGFPCLGLLPRQLSLSFARRPFVRLLLVIISFCYASGF